MVRVPDVRENYAFAETVDILGRVFYRGDKYTWKERLDYAEQLFHQTLNMSDLPLEVSCAVFLAENVLVGPKSGDLRLCYHVIPMEGIREAYEKLEKRTSFAAGAPSSGPTSSADPPGGSIGAECGGTEEIRDIYADPGAAGRGGRPAVLGSGGSACSCSAAARQEILAINRERKIAGRSPVQPVCEAADYHRSLVMRGMAVLIAAASAASML